LTSTPQIGLRASDHGAMSLQPIYFSLCWLLAFMAIGVPFEPTVSTCLGGPG
jgi:hypothetical protein